MYTLISKEMESGVIDKGLWTKALSKTKKDDQRTESIYIELRLKKVEKEYWENEKLLKKLEEQRKIQEEEEKELEVQQALIGNSDSQPISGKWILIISLVIAGLILLSFTFSFV